MKTIESLHASTHAILYDRSPSMSNECKAYWTYTQSSHGDSQLPELPVESDSLYHRLLKNLDSNTNELSESELTDWLDEAPDQMASMSNSIKRFFISKYAVRHEFNDIIQELKRYQENLNESPNYRTSALNVAIERALGLETDFPNYSLSNANLEEIPYLVWLSSYIFEDNPSLEELTNYLLVNIEESNLRNWDTVDLIFLDWSLAELIDKYVIKTKPQYQEDIQHKSNVKASYYRASLIGLVFSVSYIAYASVTNNSVYSTLLALNINNFIYQSLQLYCVVRSPKAKVRDWINSLTLKLILLSTIASALLISTYIT